MTRNKMATGIDGAVLTMTIFMIFSCLLVFPTKLDIPVEEFRAEDLGFYSSCQIITELHRDLVLNTIAPNLDVNTAIFMINKLFLNGKSPRT